MPTTTTGIATEFITFSRPGATGGGATVTDSDGKVKWAPHNLLTNSESFDAAAWTKGAASVTANSIAAPNGSTTADTLVEDGTTANHRLINTIVTIGARHTFGVFLKAGSRDWAYLRISDGGAVARHAYFNLSTGVIGTVETNLSAQITSVGSGWYLCAVTVSDANAGSNPLVIGMATADNTNSYAGNGSGSIYLWGAHLYRSDLGGMQANTSAYPMYNPTTPKNLLGQSEAFDVSPWASGNTGGTGIAPIVTVNAGVAPNGLQTADRIQFSLASGTSSSDISRRTQQFTTISNTPYTFSIWVKSYDGNPYTMHLVAASGLTVNTVFVTNEWQRVSTTANGFGVAINFGIGLRGGQTPTNSNTADILVWGAQLSDSASLDAYVPSYGAAPTAAAYYGPRRDFESSGVCKGLLVEEQRTNLLLYSAAFDVSATWPVLFGGTGIAPVVTANDAVAPDGTTTADKVVFDRGAGNTISDRSYIQQTVTVTAAATYTASFWIKAATAGDIGKQLAYRSVAGGGYSLVTLTASWQRLTIAEAAVAVSSTVEFTSRGTINSSNSVGAHIWGAQLELGSFATSYIPTGAATATRSADVAQVSTSAFPYSATEGTLVAQVDILSSGSVFSGFATLSDAISPSTSWVALYGRVSSLDSGRRANSVSATNLSITTTTAINTPVKTGVAFSVGGTDAFSNGASITTQSGVAANYANTLLRIGSFSSGGNPTDLNGHIRQITYLPRRISNTELQTRTT